MTNFVIIKFFKNRFLFFKNSNFYKDHRSRDIEPIDLTLFKMRFFILDFIKKSDNNKI